MSACIDLALALVESDLGSELARAVAKNLAAGELRERVTEVGHSGCLATVQRVLNGGRPATGCEIDEIGDVASSNAQAERVATDRRAI